MDFVGPGGFSPGSHVSADSCGGAVTHKLSFMRAAKHSMQTQGEQTAL